MLDQREAGRGPALRAAESLAFRVGLGVCLTLSLAFATGMFQRTEDSSGIGSGERINLNEAPIASLMRLPQIGVARARAIVAHRDRVATQDGRVPVFKKADDLRRIKGIGPAIVEGVRPWLRFDDPSQGGNESRTP